MKLLKITDKLYIDPKQIVSVTVKEKWQNDNLEFCTTITTTVGSHTILTADIGNLDTLINYINKSA